MPLIWNRACCHRREQKLLRRRDVLAAAWCRGRRCRLGGVQGPNGKVHSGEARDLVGFFFFSFLGALLVLIDLYLVYKSLLTGWVPLADLGSTRRNEDIGVEERVYSKEGIKAAA